MKQITYLFFTVVAAAAACSNSGDNDESEEIENVCQENVTCPAQVKVFDEVTAFDTCRNCHSATATDRRGAPANINFDTASETLDKQEEVLEEVNEGEMPPEPYASSFTQDQRNEIFTWICCN